MSETLFQPLSERRLVELFELSKLAILNEQEKEVDKSYLSNMIAFAAKIDEIDINHLLPATHAFDVKQRLRTDAVTALGNGEKVYKQLAPSMVDGFYCVPAVMNE